MYQTQIEFFWPLTEQIPLDLDYTGCDTTPKLEKEPSWLQKILYKALGFNWKDK